MTEQITLDTILPHDTEVVFNWNHRKELKKNEYFLTWGWNSGYGRQGMTVREVIEHRIKTGMGGDINDMVFENIRFVTYEQYKAIVSATSPY